MGGKASYQMYSWPETRAAVGRFYSLIRQAYGVGDTDLTWYDNPEQGWLDPDLLLSQTCGLPYRYRLKDHVQLLGTLDYGVMDCPPGYYRSCLIVRRDDPRKHLHEFHNSPIARNSVYSQSGWAALETHLNESGAAFRLRDHLIETGSHAASAQAVADGTADLASIDAVTWLFLTRHDPATRKLRVLTRTRPSPGLPLITGPGVETGPLFDAVATAIKRLTALDRDTLQIRGIVRIPEMAYLVEPLPFPLSQDETG